MRTLIQLLIFLAAICATVPAAAELYKWVDERGVTNYSNEPPPAAAPGNKLARIDNKISVYTPDESFMQAVKALRKMPTDLSKAPFAGVIWDPARQIIKSDGKTIAREVMSYMVGLTQPTKALLERYRVQRGYRRNDERVQLPDPL